MNPEIKKRLDMIRRGEVPPGYKKTKVGIIPEDWKVEKIKDVCKVITGNTPSTDNKENYGSDFLFVSPSDINGNKYVFNTEKKLSAMGFDIGRKIPAKSCLFVCIGSTIGKVAISGIDLTTNQQINAIIPEKIYYEFLYNELIRISKKVKKMAGQQAVPIVNKSEFENYGLRFPEFDEQNKIAEILSLCDETVEKQEKLIELKKEQKKGLAYKLLTGKTRLKGFIGKWQNKSLSEYFEKINEKNDENNNNILTMSAQSGLIRQEHFFSKQVASENLSRYFLLKNGDYAYNKSYSIGYPFGAIKRLEKFEKGILSPLYICFRIKKRSISNDYCKHYFDSGLLNKEIQKIAQEGARNHGLLNVSSEEFFQMCMHVPADIREQEAIAEILTTSGQEIEILEKELEMIKQQKKGLMELLLTGIIRVIN